MQQVAHLFSLSLSSVQQVSSKFSSSSLTLRLRPILSVTAAIDLWLYFWLNLVAMLTAFDKESPRMLHLECHTPLYSSPMNCFNLQYRKSKPPIDKAWHIQMRYLQTRLVVDEQRALQCVAIMIKLILIKLISVEMQLATRQVASSNLLLVDYQ